MPWKPGQSGNPGGRSRADAELRRLAREYTGEAVHALVVSLDDPKTRVAAAAELLDRGWGKPRQEVEHSGGIEVNGGIDAPRRAETWEEWHARWRADMAALAATTGTTDSRH